MTTELLQKPAPETTLLQPPGCYSASKPQTIVASLTPCRAPGEIDPKDMKNLAKELTTRGCDGLFVISSTGEMPLLDEDDRTTIIASARQGINETASNYANRAALYVGVSGTGIKQTKRYIKNAAGAGADVAVVMAPFFLKHTQIELLAYVRHLADSSSIPIAIYHHHRAASDFEVETVAQLAAHPNIVAMKDTSASMERLTALVQKTSEQDFCVFQGSEPLVMDSLKAGAHGSVTALANIAPDWLCELAEAYHNGDGQQVEKIQTRLTALWQMFRMPEVGRSIAHFTYSLRFAAQKRGFLSHTAGMVLGFAPDVSFQKRLGEHLRQVGLTGFESDQD